MTCNHKWRAPYQVAPSDENGWKSKTVYVDQVCAQQRDHSGPHRSLSNVTEEKK